MWRRVIGYKNLDELAQKIERITLRRTKEEVLKDFPPKTINNVVFDLTKDEKKLYKEIQQLLTAEIKELLVDERTLGIIPVKMLRLKQVTNHYSLVTGQKMFCTKLITLKDLLMPVIKSGEKAIIFTQFAEMAKILYAELGDYLPLMIYGDVDSEDRQIAVKKFNEDPKRQVIIMTEAGAYGLNLQAASFVFHYDMPWSVAKLMQREDRAHRIGQTKPVTVYNLIARNTIDEYVASVLNRKNKTSVKILQDQERLEESGLSTEDIMNILRI